jgi:hypothetical protein
MFRQFTFGQSAVKYFQPVRHPKLLQWIFRDHRPVRPYRRCPIIDRHHHIAQFDFMKMVTVRTSTDNPEESEDPEEEAYAYPLDLGDRS